jgi:cytochrome c
LSKRSIRSKDAGEIPQDDGIIYTQNCADCHGDKGKGNAKLNLMDSWSTKNIFNIITEEVIWIENDFMKKTLEFNLQSAFSKFLIRFQETNPRE